MLVKPRTELRFLHRPCSSLLICGFVYICLLPANVGAQVKGDVSPKTASPINKEVLPAKLKTTDPYAAHTHHSFYFADTMASALMKFTTSPDFNAKDPASLNDLGYIYYYFGEYLEARNQFNKALEINPEFADAYVNLGLTAYKVGEFEAGLQYLNKAYQMDPNRGETAYNLGLMTFEQGDFSRAAGFFEEATQKLPNDPKVWNNLGCAYLKQKNYAKAYVAFKSALDRGAAFYHAFYNMAVASILSGNYENAVEDTRKAVQLAPANSDAINLLGLAYLFNQNYLRASVALAQAVQKQPNNPSYLNNLGRAQLGLGHYREAEKAFQKALLFDPGLKPAQWNMGDLKLRQGKQDEALNLYENVADWPEAKESATFQYNWGVALYKTGDHDKARQLWETARGFEPQYVEPVYGLAVLYEEEKNFDKASSMMRQGQIMEPQSSRWVRLEGDLDMAQGKSKEALEAYEKAKQMGQKDAELFAHIQQLKAGGPEAAPTQRSAETAGGETSRSEILHLEDMGNLDAALVLARKATDENSSSPDAWEDLSNVYLKMDKKKESLESMERAFRLFPQSGHYLEECGHLAYLNDKVLVAENYFQQALKTASFSWQTYLGLGSCFYKQNYFTEAIGYWEKGSAAFPGKPEFYYNLARAHYQKGSSAQATLYYQKALNLRPNYPEVMTNMAAMDLDSDNLAAAEQKLKKSLALDPQMAETYFNFGNLDLKRGQFDEAMKHYQQGLQLNPDDPNGYYYQGVAFLREGQWTKAQSFLEKTLEKDPGHADALYNLGKVAIETDDYSGARKFFEESLKYKPGQDDAYFGIGLVYYHEGQYKDAQLDFVKAQGSFKVAHEATYYLGLTEEKLGDTDSAETFYRQSIQLRPTFGLPHLALGDLLKQKGRLLEARTEYQKAALQREFPEVAKTAENQLATLQ